MKKIKYQLAAKHTVLIALYLVVQIAFSQKTTEETYQNWTQYFANARIHNKWSVGGDVLYRWQDLDGKKLQTGLRGGITYHSKHPYTLTAGYVYFVHFPADKGATVTRLEHRPWQQLQFTSKIGRIQIQHRYRLEQRFIQRATSTELTGGYTFNFRMRYQLNLQCPLNKKEIKQGALYGILFNEIFINFGKEIVYNYFDQNRIYVGLGYQLSTSFAFTLGYQYIWQQRTRGNAFNSIHCARLTLIHNFDLRKKEPEK